MLLGLDKKVFIVEFLSNKKFKEQSRTNLTSRGFVLSRINCLVKVATCQSIDSVFLKSDVRTGVKVLTGMTKPKC